MNVPIMVLVIKEYVNVQKVGKEMIAQSKFVQINALEKESVIFHQKNVIAILDLVVMTAVKLHVQMIVIILVIATNLFAIAKMDTQDLLANFYHAQIHAQIKDIVIKESVIASRVLQELTVL
jgi:hypothetical protein